MVGFACLTLSYVIKKKNNIPKTSVKCPAEEILCHPPNDEGKSNTRLGIPQ
jgi:hypothetical protein